MDFKLGISVDSPWLLLLLGFIPLLMWVHYRYTSRLIGARKHVAVLLRSLIFILVIALIAGIHPYVSMLQRNAVFVVDRSDSVGDDNQALEFIQGLQNDDEYNYVGIVSFAKNMMIDRILQPLAQLQRPTAFHTVATQEGSNIAAALRQAAGLLNQANGGRIVLLTDGLETAGSFLKEAQVLQAMNIAVDAVMLETKSGIDAAVSVVKTPSQIKIGERYQISITVDSTNQASAELLLYEDNALIAQQAVELISGANHYLLDAIATEPGMKQYRAVIRMQGDSESKNNNGYSFSRVDGPAGVIIVEGEKGSSRNIEAALAASYIGYRTITPVELSFELTSYLQAEAIIFNNVSAVDLSQIKMDHIASAVRNYGVGFVMLGGNDSFGLGGYFDTPIEQILPVNMQLSGKKVIPDLQLMLVIDHSGSMEGTKMELAKEAAARTVELMRPVDTVGVIAFDSMPAWVVSPVKLQDRDAVIGSIMSIQPAGGTDIYPALARAFEGFNLEAKGRKHMILLTDGISPYTPAYEHLLNSLKEQNITLSTVAVGQDSDAIFLRTLAEGGGGRAYYTEDASTLPAIFSRETTLMSRAYIVEGELLPQIGYAGSWSQLWQAGIPKLDAYVATSAKSTAEIALWSPQEDPLLARWQVGSGKSVAFMSDVNGKWSEDWVAWSDFPEVFTQWVRWTYPQFTPTRYTIESGTYENQDKLIVTSNEEHLSNLGLTLNNDGETVRIPLVPIASGKYEGNVGELDSGVYFTQIGEFAHRENESDTEVSGELQNGVTTGFIVPYSSEYRLDIDPTVATEKLKTLVEMTGGRILGLEAADQVFLFEPTTNRQRYDWTREILLFLLVLWLIDIANRRLSWSLPQRKAKTAAPQNEPNTVETRGILTASSKLLQRLQSSKESIGQRPSRLTRLDDDPTTTSSQTDEKIAQASTELLAKTISERRNGETNLTQEQDQKQSNEYNQKQGNEHNQKQSQGQSQSAQTSDAHHPKMSVDEATSGGASETMNRLLAAKNRKKR